MTMDQDGENGVQGPELTHAEPPTLDDAAEVDDGEPVQTHLGKSTLLLLVLPPVGLFAFYCSLMSHLNPASKHTSAARRWGQRSAYAGIFGIALLAACLVIALIVFTVIIPVAQLRWPGIPSL